MWPPKLYLICFCYFCINIFKNKGIIERGHLSSKSLFKSNQKITKLVLQQKKETPTLLSLPQLVGVMVTYGHYYPKRFSSSTENTGLRPREGPTSLFCFNLFCRVLLGMSKALDTSLTLLPFLTAVMAAFSWSHVQVPFSVCLR